MGDEVMTKEYSMEFTEEDELLDHIAELEKELKYAEEHCLFKDCLKVAELEKKISVLLSCKNCPENKGGLLCQKECENKCLAQKIQFIKELQEENAELKEQINEWLNAYSDTSLAKVLRDCIYKNEKLSSQEQQQLSAWVECAMDFGSNLDECADQLTKAKDIMRMIVYWSKEQQNKKELSNFIDKAEQFLSEVEKC